MEPSAVGGERVRLLPLEGTYNFRDLGGYPTVDGRSTRWGRLFRSDALQELTAADHDHLTGIGLATVVDLREPDEASRVGRWPLGDGEGPGTDGFSTGRSGQSEGTVDSRSLRYVNLPVIPPGACEDPTVPTASRDGRAERYLWYLEAGREAITAALELIAGAENLPLVFHCAAGKDRTGIVAAMTLAAVGVEREAIVADYAATAAAMDRIIARLRAHPVYRAGIEAIQVNDHYPDGDVMERFLDGLDERHGGAAEWMRSAGLDGEVLDHLRHQLVG